MTKEVVIERLHSLYEQIEVKEKMYEAAKAANENPEILRSIKTGISLLKNEMQQLEDILLEMHSPKR